MLIRTCRLNRTNTVCVLAAASDYKVFQVPLILPCWFLLVVQSPLVDVYVFASLCEFMCVVLLKLLHVYVKYFFKK